MSLRCIEEHGYNRSAPECQPHFDAYKACKKQMADEKREASRQGGRKGPREGGKKMRRYRGRKVGGWREGAREEAGIGRQEG